MNVLQKSGAFVAVGALAMATTPPAIVEDVYESSEAHSYYLPSIYSGVVSGSGVARFTYATEPVAVVDEQEIQVDDEEYDFGDPEPVRMNRNFVKQLISARVNDPGFNSTEV